MLVAGHFAWGRERGEARAMCPTIKKKRKKKRRKKKGRRKDGARTDL